MVYNYHIGIEDSTMKNKKQAFTLAEVLLVLAIIGVIAAVTIPAIMQQSSEKKFSALAKKAQSTLQNAVDLKIATVPVSPRDLGVNMFTWLIMGEEDGTNTLKAIKTNSNSQLIQTPDGMTIFNWSNNSSSGANSKTGYNSSIYIDLNGVDPPTKTKFPDSSAITNNLDNATAYDLIQLEIKSDGIVTINTGDFVKYKATDRAKKYLGLQ